MTQGSPESPRSEFSKAFLRDVFGRIGVAVLAMACAFGGAALGRDLPTEWGAFLGAVAGLVLGGLAGVFLLRRLRRD
ncbi:hypothetical protein [Marmoricola sp. RAF53]|uniref:hypothetical protein n=1 Tax=Marmoricola sp. RAF53 TaxID=3233059 RepID=UPI003F9A4B95